MKRKENENERKEKKEKERKKRERELKYSQNTYKNAKCLISCKVNTLSCFIPS
jgi:hypothetical protein